MISATGHGSFQRTTGEAVRAVLVSSAKVQLARTTATRGAATRLVKVGLVMGGPAPPGWRSAAAANSKTTTSTEHGLFLDACWLAL